LDAIIAALPPEQIAKKFKFFDEDPSRGWTHEQYVERVWGYNNALEDVIALLESAKGQK
jgi:hypothetical protein